MAAISLERWSFKWIEEIYYNICLFKDRSLLKNKIDIIGNQDGLIHKPASQKLYKFCFSKMILMESWKVSCGIILKRVGDAKLETFLIYQSIYENVYAGGNLISFPLLF